MKKNMTTMKKILTPPKGTPPKKGTGKAAAMPIKGMPPKKGCK